ncbi:MAG: hypothetical protein JWL86_1205 [Rhizobium sp.]|nr:hypothetical protein [Rhizobium sp.]
MPIKALMIIVITLLSANSALAENTSIGGPLPNPKRLAHYAAGDIECTIGGKQTKNVKPTYYEFYYYAEMPTRTWLHIHGGTGPQGDFLLGNDDGCHVSGTRSVTLP